MLKRINAWLGFPGMVLNGLLIFGLIGTFGAILVAPLSMIPLIELVALLYDPFPTILLYSSGALVTYLVIRQILWLMPIMKSVMQWIAGAFAVGLVVTVGFHVPSSWNQAAGLVSPVPQDRPPAIAVPSGGTIALIVDDAGPECGSLCLTLLIQEKVQFVEVAATQREPTRLEALPGIRYSLKPQTSTCLKGMRDYVFSGEDADRFQYFLKSDFFPIEYYSCLEQIDVIVRPERQVTLVEWIGGSEESGDQKVGFLNRISLIRTVVPQGEGQPPKIQEARYRSGYRYLEPLYFSSFQGNAGMGGYFSPTIAISHFQEPGFLDWSEPRFWQLLTGSEELGRKTATWLDGVVDRGNKD